MPACLLNKKMEKIQSHGLTLWKNVPFSTFLTSCFHSLQRLFYLENRQTLYFCLFWVKHSRNILKTSARVSSGIPNTEKQMKARRRRQSAFSFDVIGTPDETRSTSFWDDFSNETIKKICSDTFFCIVLPKRKNNNLRSDAILPYYVQEPLYVALLQHAWLIVLV